MLLTEYMIGRRPKKGGESVGEPYCLLVNSVMPADCLPGRSYLVQKLARRDLIVEFVEKGGDGDVVEWINLPNLPQDVVDLLLSAKTIPLVDVADDTTVDCCLVLSEERRMVGK